MATNTLPFLIFCLSEGLWVGSKMISSFRKRFALRQVFVSSCSACVLSWSPFRRSIGSKKSNGERRKIVSISKCCAYLLRMKSQRFCCNWDSDHVFKIAVMLTQWMLFGIKVSLLKWYWNCRFFQAIIKQSSNFTPHRAATKELIVAP